MTETVQKRIKKLEFISGFLGTMAPVIGALIGFDKKMGVILIVGGLAIAIQPFIYLEYKKINQTDVYKTKKFLPLVFAIALIVFLVVRNHYDWRLF